MTERLSLRTYLNLPNKVIRPKYDFKAHKAGIVHIGIGAFHRGHQAVFTDDAMANSGGDWRIIGVSLRSPSVSEQLNPQDGLYTVSAKFNGQFDTRLIGAIEKVLVAPHDPSVVIATIASAQTKIVTLTVTEKGYHYNMSTHALAHNSADIQHDIDNPNSPVSMPGFLVAACAKRMHNKGGKLTVISCDNLPDNGQVARKVVLDLAAKIQPDVVDWIAQNVGFCNSMVDRIVPAVTDQDKQSMQEVLGLQDEAMISTETFKQWVIEDNFYTEIPDWGSAGALIVKNVEAYEKLKLRTLNGAHSALAYMGVLLGYKWIHEAIADPVLLALIQQLMQNESGPSLSSPVNFDLASYQRQTLARFQNNEIQYATQQVAMDGSQKMVQRIFTPLADNLAANKPKDTSILTAVVAAWLIYLRGEDEQGNRFEISDPMAELLHRIAQTKKQSTETCVNALLKQTDIVPCELSKHKTFVDNLVQAISKIDAQGLSEYLQTLLK